MPPDLRSSTKHTSNGAVHQHRNWLGELNPRPYRHSTGQNRYKTNIYRTKEQVKRRGHCLKAKTRTHSLNKHSKRRKLKTELKLTNRKLKTDKNSPETHSLKQEGDSTTNEGDQETIDTHTRNSRKPSATNKGDQETKDTLTQAKGNPVEPIKATKKPKTHSLKQSS